MGGSDIHITFQTSSEQSHSEHESVGDMSLNKEQKVKDGEGGLVKPWTTSSSRAVPCLENCPRGRSEKVSRQHMKKYPKGRTKLVSSVPNEREMLWHRYTSYNSLGHSKST